MASRKLVRIWTEDLLFQLVPVHNQKGREIEIKTSCRENLHKILERRVEEREWRSWIWPCNILKHVRVHHCQHQRLKIRHAISTNPLGLSSSVASLSSSHFLVFINFSLFAHLSHRLLVCLASRQVRNPILSPPILNFDVASVTASAFLVIYFRFLFQFFDRFQGVLPQCSAQAS